MFCLPVLRFKNGPDAVGCLEMMVQWIFLFNVLMPLLIIGIDSCKYYQIDISRHMFIADIPSTMLPA